MDKDKINRLERLILSGQSVHTICEGRFNENNTCIFKLKDYTKFKCGYKIDGTCTYQNKEIRGYN